MKKKTALWLAVIFVVSSCASIIHGPTQVVDFSSQPSGAKIVIDGKEYGETPLAITLQRIGREVSYILGKKKYDVKIILDGYYPYELKIRREMDLWFLVNIVLVNPIGIIIDAASGSMYKLTPSQVIAQMKESMASHYTDDDRIYIEVTLHPDPSWEEIGQLKKVDE